MGSLLADLSFLGPESASLSNQLLVIYCLSNLSPALPAPEHGTGVRPQGMCSNLQVRTTGHASPLNSALKFGRSSLLVEQSSTRTLKERGWAEWAWIRC